MIYNREGKKVIHSAHCLLPPVFISEQLDENIMEPAPKRLWTDLAAQIWRKWRGHPRVCQSVQSGTLEHKARGSEYFQQRRIPIRRLTVILNTNLFVGRRS
jgi:hypothetical protein